MKIVFEVPGIPCHQPRARSAKCKSKEWNEIVRQHPDLKALNEEAFFDECNRRGIQLPMWWKDITLVPFDGVRVFTHDDDLDGRVPAFKHSIKTEFLKAIDGISIEKFPTDKPISLGIILEFIPPKTTPKWKLKKIEESFYPKVTKPDLSNYYKIIEDTLNGLAWKDDSQVWKYLEPSKVYSTRNCLTVKIETFEEER